MQTTWTTRILGSVLIGLAGCATPVHQTSQKPLESHTVGDVLREIRLDDANRLVLREKNKGSMAVVEIVFGQRVVQSYEIGNALVEKVSINAVHLDPGHAQTEYLVRIPDRSSTFGAEKGIIVYRLQWWEFLLVPDDRFQVEDIDGDGFAELRCDRIQNKTYSLVHGVLREKNSR
jgi:hypothetical protein